MQSICSRVDMLFSVFKGINVMRKTATLDTERPEKAYNLHISFNGQPSSGSWSLVSFVAHQPTCFNRCKTEQLVTASSPYTLRQVERLLCAHISEHPSISTVDVETILKSAGIYTRNITQRHYRANIAHIRRQMPQTRAVAMYALKDYCSLLEKMGHVSKVVTMTRTEM